jgi:hypothetical protein
MLRLGLLAVLVVMIVALALLLPWSRDAIGVEVAEGLLQHFKECGESYSHVASILGPPSEYIGRLGKGNELCMWNYAREGFLEKELTQFVVAFDENKLRYVRKNKWVISGSALWEQRWDRMKDRLMIGK